MLAGESDGRLRSRSRRSKLASQVVHKRGETQCESYAAGVGEALAEGEASLDPLQSAVRKAEEPKSSAG